MKERIQQESEGKDIAGNNGLGWSGMGCEG